MFEPFDETYSIEEKSPNGVLVAQLVAIDNDRDGNKE